MKNKNILAKFPHQISILKNKTKNDIDSSQWEEFVKCYASIGPLCDNNFSFLEGVSFGNLITEEYFYFKIRFSPGIIKDMRISFALRLFEIKRIINHKEKNQLLSIIALER